MPAKTAKPIESTTRVPDYYQFFNRFGQTGEPTFSRVTVSTDAVNISTWTVDDAGVPTLFDAFKVIKDESGTTAIFSAAKDAGKLSLYPNPASEHVTVNCQEKIVSVRIFSLSGKLVKMQSGSDNVVELSDVSNGIYIVSATTTGGVYNEQLIVKK